VLIFCNLGAINIPGVYILLLGKMLMKTRKILFLHYFLVDFFLGLLLIVYAPKLAQLLGVPKNELAFYPNILGAVFIVVAYTWQS